MLMKFLTSSTWRVAWCMHMPELRVCAFHLNAHAFQSGITAGKNALTKILITAVADQVDVIACDANQFTNRNFRSDRRADPATGAVLTILDQILVSANKKREPSKRITYNWEVSTLAKQLAALEGQDADCDCLLQIALIITARTCTRCGAGHPIFRKTVAKSVTKARLDRGK